MNTQMWWKVKQSYEHPDVVKGENNHNEHPDVVNGETIIWTPRCGERWKQSYEHPDVVKGENNHNITFDMHQHFKHWQYKKVTYES